MNARKFDRGLFVVLLLLLLLLSPQSQGQRHRKAEEVIAIGKTEVFEGGLKARRAGCGTSITYPCNKSRNMHL